MSEAKPTDRHIDAAHRLWRKHFGGELYASHVLKLAGLLAEHEQEVREREAARPRRSP